jgi:hypothetical protein
MTQQNESPLEEFDARLVQAPLQGLLRNMDGELVRRLKHAMSVRDKESERRLSLFLIVLSFTRNSYEAARFLCSDANDNAKRKREFILILPPTNRQLLDLLFTLVFMLDDFPTRSMAYELSGYRQAREEYDKFHARYGAHPKWQAHFLTLREWLPTMEKYLTITPEQKANPALIKYWRAPYRLMQTVTVSQPFMEFLEKWLYGETSAQAHLNAAGLFAVSGFLISEFAPEDERKIIEERNFEKYKFRHFSRSLITVLAIASEIDNFCRLKNRETLSHLWVFLVSFPSSLSFSTNDLNVVHGGIFRIAFSRSVIG